MKSGIPNGISENDYTFGGMIRTTESRQIQCLGSKMLNINLKGRWNLDDLLRPGRAGGI